MVERVLTDWPTGYRYVWNRPALSLVENMNRAVELSTGEWVMQLDDDYLLPGAGVAMLDAIRRASPGESVLLFGVHIVDIDGVRRREQTFRRERYLEPREALRRLLRNSSFVREPAAVVRRAAMEQEGLFDTTVGGATETDMWVRLFSRYGARCLPQATGAYTIHEAAATTGMWNPGTIRVNGEIFDRASPGASCPSAPSAAGRLTGTTSSSWRAPTVGCGWDGGPRPRGAAAVQAAGGPPLGRVAEVAARAGRVHGRHSGGAPKASWPDGGSLQPIQPDLPPVRVDAARALAVVGPTASDVVQDDAGILEPQHPAALLVDDPLDPAQHPGLLPAVAQHLPVERHTAIGVAGVERRDDLLPALDPNPLAGPQAG